VKIFWVLVLLRTQRDQLQQATKTDNKFVYTPVTKGSTNAKAQTGALCIFRLALEPCGQDLGGVLDAGPGGLLCLCDGSLHHRLLGGVGVPALETLMTSSGVNILAPVESNTGSTLLTSRAGSPDRTWLKPRGASTMSVWPRKS
jgi:hypothetical protein